MIFDPTPDSDYLQDAIEEIEQLEQELSRYKQAYEVLKEANEFYGRLKNWISLGVNEEGIHDVCIFSPDDYEYIYGANVCGKRAREAKQKCEEILG